MTPMSQLSRLDRYRTALRPGSVQPDSQLAALIIASGLGPFWHEETSAEAFKPARMAAVALYAAQIPALREIHEVLDAAGIAFAVFKGAANRELLYADPSLRLCYDLDLLVARADRHRAVEALQSVGFTAYPDANSISRELILSRNVVDIDLHWGVLRAGRLRYEPAEEILERRRKVNGLWMPSTADSVLLLLVHPAFAKHVSSTEMALHRVLDIAEWWRKYPVDLAALDAQLKKQGVRTAAWTVLEWVKLLLPEFACDTTAWQPLRLRRAWLRTWLRNDWPGRMNAWHALRLLAFSPFLHDTPSDAWRALQGWRFARRNRDADLAEFS